MKRLVTIVSGISLLVSASALALECPDGMVPEFADVAQGHSMMTGDTINGTYQATQTAAIDEAFGQLQEIAAECNGIEGAVLVRDAEWRRTPMGPARACFLTGVGYKCKIMATKVALCCELAE